MKAILIALALSTAPALADDKDSLITLGATVAFYHTQCRPVPNAVTNVGLALAIHSIDVDDHESAITIIAAKLMLAKNIMGKKAACAQLFQTLKAMPGGLN